METIKRKLRERKKALDKLEVPGDLEVRLAGALEGREPVKRSSTRWLVKVAALCLAVVLVGYNLNTLAFYGKKLIGYDQVMTGTLRELNELGKGQLIGESHHFADGVSVTLDGIMLDDSQLLAFYTVRDPQGDVNSINLHPHTHMKGFFGRYFMGGGQGKVNDEQTEIKWMMSFAPPFFLERTLHFSFSYRGADNHLQEGIISFKLDRAQAMGSTLKKALNETVELEHTTLRFDSILASPTRTVIYGSMQNILELARDQIKGERLRPDSLTIRLIANGDEVIAQQGGSMGTDMRGITFEQSFDALPAELQSLHIQIDSMSVDRDVKETVGLDREEKDKSVKILGQDVKINGVYIANGDTFVTITTDDSTILTRVFLMTDGDKIPLERAVTDGRDKLADGSIRHTRTLHFPGAGEELALVIERMTFTELCDVKLEISLD